MQLAKVIGKIIATNKSGRLAGLKLLVVKQLDEKLNPLARTEVCTDTVEANSGDIVLLCSSSSARKTKMTDGVCTDNTAVALIDSIASNKKYVYKK
jgi:microcompartment protein CcmK/EutM